MKQDMIVILDLGSEENSALAREIRALGVYSEIHPHDITKEELMRLPNVKGVILNGGPNRIVDGKPIDVLDEIYECGLPFASIDHPSVNSVALKPNQPEDIKKFVFTVCGCEANWNMENFLADKIELILKQV